ncbi:hypothetical protein D3Z09_18270 [Rahnella aquatilis]|nr:hypothetical protein D3Z09_18270 [Rahnella aquatilis]
MSTPRGTLNMNLKSAPTIKPLVALTVLGVLMGLTVLAPPTAFAGGAGAAPAAGRIEPAPDLTPAQLNEMLATLRMQVAQQNALLQMLAERNGTTAPGAVAAVPGSDVPVGAAKAADAAGAAPPPTPVPGAPAVAGPVSSAPAAATAPLPDPVAIVPPVPVAPVSPSGVAVAPVQAVPDVAAENTRKAYASGVSVWREIQRSVETQRALGIRLDTKEVLAGIQDSANGSSLRFSEQDLTAALSSLNQDYMARAASERENQRIDGKVYRQEFSKTKGVKSDAGSWYQVLSRGTGRNLSTSDVVSFTVTGTLPDGTVFDASGQSGQTKTAKVGALMPAVAIGLQKIARGGHIKVVVPPEKGYGDAGLPPTIPGGATLIFDIQVADAG